MTDDNSNWPPPGTPVRVLLHGVERHGFVSGLPDYVYVFEQDEFDDGHARIADFYHTGSNSPIVLIETGMVVYDSDQAFLDGAMAMETIIEATSAAVMKSNIITLALGPGWQPEIEHILQLGYAVLMGKELILVRDPNTFVPKHLITLASKIISMDLGHLEGVVKFEGDIKDAVEKAVRELHPDEPYIVRDHSE